MEGRLARWEVPAVPSEVRAIRRAVADVVGSTSLSATRLGDVMLAVSEAATNAVMHAFPQLPPGSITVTVRAGPSCLQITVADDGVGMRSRTDSPGAGYGRRLMQQVCDEVREVPVPGGGLQVLLTFLLDA